MIQIKGTDNIIIRRGDTGVCEVEASCESDVYFGLGYCHAMDRSVQILMMRILGQGRACECLQASDELFKIDKFFRKMNWFSKVSEQIELLSDEEKRILQAYCDGLNLWLLKKTTWEIKILRYKPEKWIIEDILLLARMTGFLSLAQSQGEIERIIIQLISNGVDKEKIRELIPNIKEDYDEDLIRKIKIIESVVPASVKWNSLLAPAMASNAWVVSGNKTASGKAMLANDPHLEINRLPSVWYEVALKCGTRWFTGFTMPGLCGLLAGRTNNLSWGVTYSFLDATDSWIEQCKDGKYLKDGNWIPFRKRIEKIIVKGKNPVDICFYENEHGVLEGNPFEEGYYLATRWTVSEYCGRSLSKVLKIWHADNIEEGMLSIGRLEISFNWLFVDVEGNIGYQMSGLSPIRKEGTSGLLPMLGWDCQYDWSGFRRFDELPRSFNPPCGYIISANQDMNHLCKHELINMPMGEYRAERIEQLLRDRSDLKAVDMFDMQYDVFSTQAEEFMQIIRPLLPSSDKAEILKNWNFSYDCESLAAFFFEEILTQVYRETFGKTMGLEVYDFLRTETGIFIDFFKNFDRIILKEKSSWFGERSRDEIYSTAIENALKLPVKKWGDVNKIIFKNVLFDGKLPSFLGFDKGPVALMGGRATIHQGQVYRNAGRDTSFAPSFHMVSDMADNHIYTNIAGGHTDRRFSKWYANEIDNWQNKKYKIVKVEQDWSAD